MKVIYCWTALIPHVTNQYQKTKPLGIPVIQTIYLASLVDDQVMEILRSVSRKSFPGFVDVPCDLLIKCASLQ